MEYMKINQVYWDNRIHVLFIWTPDISFSISFHIPFAKFSRKWVRWRKARGIYTNTIPIERMPETTTKPPIRDISCLIENMIKRFKTKEDNSDKAIREWIIEQK